MIIAAKSERVVKLCTVLTRQKLPQMIFRRAVKKSPASTHARDDFAESERVFHSFSTPG